MPYALRTRYGPAQRLHSSKRAAHYGRKLFNAEMIGQPRLGPNPVFHRKHGKSGAPVLACGRVDAGRAGGTKARTDVIDAENEKKNGITSFARAHHDAPPT